MGTTINKVQFQLNYPVNLIPGAWQLPFSDKHQMPLNFSKNKFKVYSTQMYIHLYVINIKWDYMYMYFEVNNLVLQSNTFTILGYLHSPNMASKNIPV
jgi:hypothetical protein